MSKTYRLFIYNSIDERVVHIATVLQTVVRPLETIGGPAKVRKPQGFGLAARRNCRNGTVRASCRRESEISSERELALAAEFRFFVASCKFDLRLRNR